MHYGVVCFATLLSFTGTVLGGIWADQSWGRFWGWDPKENGALLIVIWNALILHARWGGLVKAAGRGRAGRVRQHRHDLVVVRHQPTRRRPARLRGFTTGANDVQSICASVGFTLLGGLGLMPLQYWRSTKAEIGTAPKKKDEIIDLELA